MNQYNIMQQTTGETERNIKRQRQCRRSGILLICGILIFCSVILDRKLQAQVNQIVSSQLSSIQTKQHEQPANQIPIILQQKS